MDYALFTNFAKNTFLYSQYDMSIDSINTGFEKQNNVSAEFEENKSTAS